MKKYDFIKQIDGILYYSYDYAYFLYEKLKQKDDKINKAIDYIKENSYIAQDKEINGIPLMSKRLDKCDDLLEILGDKENEKE